VRLQCFAHELLQQRLWRCKWCTIALASVYVCGVSACSSQANDFAAVPQLHTNSTQEQDEGKLTDNC
jgi:hypothetical protein